MRGFAAISVLVYHVIEFNDWQAFPKTWGIAWFRWGWAAVDIFYVISGFVITLSALNLRDNQELTEREIFLRFMEKRLRRIAPLHYLTLLIFMVLASKCVLAPDFDLNFLAHIFFVHNLFPDYHRSLNAANWTLGVEMQFYIVLILVIRFVTPGNLTKFIIAAFLLAFAWRCFAFYLSGYLHSGSTEHIFIFATQLPGMVDFFACGMLIAFFVRSRYFLHFGHSIRFRFAVFAAFVLLGLLASETIPAIANNYWSTAWMVVFPRSMLSVLFALLVALLCTFRLTPAIRRSLAPLIYLGTISYGIYLFHFPFVLIFRKFPLDNIWRLILTLIASITCAALSWHFFEKKFLKRQLPK